ncbi:MAG: nitroreductase/quinone reductase family protein [Chloroflexia bacterium]
MANKSQIPWFLPMANKMVTTMLRAGVKLSGPGKCPMYLLTVPGRKSGLLRTTPIAVFELDGKRYLGAPYGIVDWVRNLRAAGEATFTRGRRTERIRPIELPENEASVVLKKFIGTGNPIIRLFGVTKDSTPEDIERISVSLPVFLLQSATATATAA